MKINFLFLLLPFFFPLDSFCQSDAYYGKSDFPFRRKTNIHFNVGYKYSFHYGRLVLANPVVTNTSGRDLETIKQFPSTTFDISLTFNHFIDNRQEVFGGFGVSEHIYEEEGQVVYALSNGNTNRYTYSDLFYYEHFYFLVGHRYTFPAKGQLFPYIENSFQSDWLSEDPRTYFPANFFNRNGYSYKFHLGVRAIGEIPILFGKNSLKVNALFSVFFQSALVKYNFKKFNRDYYPYAYGVNLSIVLGKLQWLN